MGPVQSQVCRRVGLAPSLALWDWTRDCPAGGEEDDCGSDADPVPALVPSLSEAYGPITTEVLADLYDLGHRNAAYLEHVEKFESQVNEGLSPEFLLGDESIEDLNGHEYDNRLIDTSSDCTKSVYIKPTDISSVDAKVDGPSDLGHRLQAFRFDDCEKTSCTENFSAALTSVGREVLGRHVALDCEMVGVGHRGCISALARVSIVDFHCRQVYDSYVLPLEPVTDYRTRYSGITPECMAVARPYDEVQQTVARILKGRILIGHDIRNDLDVLDFRRPKRVGSVDEDDDDEDDDGDDDNDNDNDCESIYLTKEMKNGPTSVGELINENEVETENHHHDHTSKETKVHLSERQQQTIPFYYKHPVRDIRDTVSFPPFRQFARRGRPSLSHLARVILGVSIQQGEHSSVQDALATMLLYKRYKADFDIEYARRFPGSYAMPNPKANTVKGKMNGKAKTKSKGGKKKKKKR